MPHRFHLNELQNLFLRVLDRVILDLLQKPFRARLASEGVVIPRFVGAEVS